VVQARRAKVRPARVIIPLVVAAALLVGGSFAAVKFWPDATTAGPQPETSATTIEQLPSTAESSPSPSASTSQSDDAAATTAAAAQALETCRAKVEAADEVLKQGKTGVEHWAIHVGAQKAYVAGKISVDEMKARFKKTRLKGPEDVRRYDDALSAYQELEGSCEAVEGADEQVAATLASCQKRSKAQPAVMRATAAGMKDWKAHLTFMQRNALHKEGSPSEAQATWLKQYKAAPKNINAFKKATSNFEDAPSC
jgi:hypothetical protein